MKKFHLLYLVLFCAVKGIAQDTTTFYFDDLWKSTDREHAVYYRKATWNEGAWHVRDYYNNGVLQMKGKYSNESLTSHIDTFEYYHPNGMLASKGLLTNGKRIGVWYSWFDDGSKNYKCNHKDTMLKYTFYHDNGMVSAVEEYRNDTELVSAKFFDNTGALTTSNSYIENDPTIDGEEVDWYRLFGKYMHFPQDIQGNRLYGKAQFYVVVDRQGNISMGEVIGFVHPEMDLALQRAIKKFPKCTPAIYHNRLVIFKALLRFNFTDE